jgi:2-deoxystreptamine N-acetyl-D-glucosaminyltransferase/2-deoxystreptamine glucosyltransferase
VPILPLQRVLRLCSVFEPPPEVLRGRGRAFDPIGGMQNHTACLTRALDVLGVTQDVVTTRPPGARRQHALGEQATVHRVGLPVRAARQGWAPGALRLAHRLGAHADLVHVHLGEDLAVVPVGLSAARRHGLPLVLTIHLSLDHTYAPYGARSRWFQRLGAALERRGVAAADAVVCLAPRLAERLVDAGVDAAKVHVVPSGVEPRRFEAPGPDLLAGRPRPRILFCGRLARQKGVETLVRAAALLRTPGARIELVGDGPERERLAALVAQLGVGDRVTLHGFVGHDEVPGVLRGADALVLPSVYEELGSVLLEGLQAGLPIVASRVGGIPHAVGDAGLLVEPSDPAALAAALDRVLGEPGLAGRLRAAAGERAREFDWDVLGRRVLGVYAQAAGRAATAGEALDDAVPPPAAAAPAAAGP